MCRTNNGSYIELFNASHASQSGMINGALSSSFLNIITVAPVNMKDLDYLKNDAILEMLQYCHGDVSL